MYFFHAISQLSLVNLATNFNGKEVRIADVKRNCPSIETNFWNCMNHTLRGNYFDFLTMTD